MAARPVALDLVAGLRTILEEELELFYENADILNDILNRTLPAMFYT
ncbi:hypothetical protein PG987_000541 [Apiospora arundinis]